MTDTENGKVLKFSTTPLRVPFQVNEERFEAWKVPGIMFMELLGKLGGGNENEQAGLMWDVFKSTMEDQEYERFRTFAVDPSNGVDAGILFEIISALVEASTGRPTEPASSSESGQEGDGAGAEQSSDVKVST